MSLFATGKKSMQHAFCTILPAASTGKTLADSASAVGAKHRKLPSGIAPPEKKQPSKSVQILSNSGLQIHHW